VDLRDQAAPVSCWGMDIATFAGKHVFRSVTSMSMDKVFSSRHFDGSPSMVLCARLSGFVISLSSSALEAEASRRLDRFAYPRYAKLVG
jgi:hypothetical protein